MKEQSVHSRGACLPVPITTLHLRFDKEAGTLGSNTSSSTCRQGSNATDALDDCKLHVTGL